MTEVIQTKVNKKAVDDIDEKIADLNSVIEFTNKNIDYLMEKKKRLLTTYFCGIEISFEEEGKYDGGRLYYDLGVHVSDTCWITARAYTNARDRVTFVANIEGTCIKHKRLFDIKTFDRAKEICRQWLADLIYADFQND